MPDTSETNNIDRALVWAEALPSETSTFQPVNERTKQLAAEVRRLREESAEAKAMMVKAYRRLDDSHAEAERLQAVVADQALTIGTLKDSNAAQACVIRDYGLENSKLQALLNEERSLSAAAAQHTTALERRVSWFDQQAKLLDALLDALMEHNEQAYDWVAFRELSRWRQANPKPGATT